MAWTRCAHERAYHRHTHRGDEVEGDQTQGGISALGPCALREYDVDAMGSFTDNARTATNAESDAGTYLAWTIAEGGWNDRGGGGGSLFGGSAGSSEDQQRISEAGAINRSMLEALSVEPVQMRIISGDLNLVGSRPPLDVLRNGLDADGSDLEIADARVLGDAAYTTWREDGNIFTPGRLDYAVYSGSAVRQARAFVLDARVLSDRALDIAGLDPTDTDASDHLPMVIDLMPN